MISKDELEKLTVPQLREKLKSRKLPYSGTKAEIINRLYDNILAEETLLGKSEGHENADTSEFDLANVDVDEVLAEEILSSPITKKTTEMGKSVGAKNEESILGSFNPIEKTETQSKPSIKSPEIETNGNNNPIKSSSPAKSMDGNNTKTTTNAKHKSVTAPSYTLEEEKKMLERAKRFGLPCKTERSPATDEVIKKRAIRFGPVDPEATKKEERSKRFGPVTNDSSNTSANSSSPKENDILAKRAKRFGP